MTNIPDIPFTELTVLKYNLRKSLNMFRSKYYSEGDALLQECIIELQYILANLEGEELENEEKILDHN